jgi:hypothetical protein
MSNYNVTRFFRSARHSLKGGSISFFFEFVEKLHSYELFTFQSRIYNKVLLFAHGIKTNSKSPLELKSYLEIEVPDEEQTTERPETLPPGNVPYDVENTQTDLRKVQPIQGTYSLRGRTIIKSIITEN